MSLRNEQKILLIDIETSPNLVYTWGLYQQNIAVNQIVKASSILCWSAKWLGRGKMYHSSVNVTTKQKMLEEIHALLSEADAVIHYNGTSFDIPRLNQEFSEMGMKPPSPVIEIDLLRVVRRRFSLPSNKLEFVAPFFKLGKKVQHPGMPLWLGCMNGEQKWWRLMKRYNKMDVLLLERLYNHLLPWVPSIPSLHAKEDAPRLVGNKRVCTVPGCGGKVIAQGKRRFGTGIYVRYQCTSCGKWLRGAKKLNQNSPHDLRD